jgi:hypothetical protein
MRTHAPSVTVLVALFAAAPGALAQTAAAQSCKSGDAVFRVHSGNIDITKKQAADYKPGARDYYVRDLNDNENLYLKAALSPSRRQEWLGRWKDQKFVRCMNIALDELAAIAKKTLPSYRPGGYTVRNAAEEQVLRTGLRDPGNATVISSGLASSSWKIEQNRRGIPVARYKHGMVHARYKGVDDGFCRIVYVNLVQDHAGGGTYGDSRAVYIKSEFAGCP